MSSQQPPYQNVQAPHFAAAGMSAGAAQAVASRGTPATLNLDDIFGDCFFTPEGDTVFMGDDGPGGGVGGGGGEGPGLVGSGEPAPTRVASRPAGGGGGGASFSPVGFGGGISTTGLDRTDGTRATVMGAAGEGGAPYGQQVPQRQQQRHHMQFATPAMLSGAGGGGGALHGGGGGAAKQGGGGAASGPAGAMGGGKRNVSDRQKVERRERNREHAKRSRIRKKFLLESLQQSVSLLKEENEKLRGSIKKHLGNEADELLTKENLAAAGSGGGLIAGSSSDANKVLDDPDFSFIKALQTAQQNFVVTDPSLPDNPIVYATQGFLNLTGYTLDQVLGRNCRFLQGPETDPKAVEKIRTAIEGGSDMSVCLLNYRVDGTTFWNQFFIAALRDAAGLITNYVGVQCKVSDQYAANVCKRQEEMDRAALNDDMGADEIPPGGDGHGDAISPAAGEEALAPVPAS